MAAARRSSGSGTVVALVVSIVVAFVAIGAFIWFFQQYSTVSKAAIANQAELEATVGTVFRKEGWKLPINEGAEYGIKYPPEAYQKVAERLRDAARYEKLMGQLGWKSPEGVAEELKVSALKGDAGESYKTMQGLVDAYESEYLRLTTDVLPGKERELAKQKELLAELGAARDEERKELTERLTTEVANHTAAMIEAGKQFEQMVADYQSARAETMRGQEELDAARKEWDAESNELALEIAKWKQLYEKEALGEETGGALTAEGKVLKVDPAYELVMLEGGKDIGQERNTNIVVYSESPRGLRVEKGRLRVSGVYESTSMAMVTAQEPDRRFVAGDLFVRVPIWEMFYAPVEAAAPVLEEAAPEVEAPAEAMAPAEEEAVVLPEEVTEELLAPEEEEEMVAPEEEEEEESFF